LSVSRVGTLLFPAIAATKDQAPCLAEVGQALSGKARYLYELAAGNSAVASEDPVVPANPQGLTGVDLSGPPWGSAILRPVALFGGVANNANLQAPVSNVIEANTVTFISVPLWLFVRPHTKLPDDYEAPEGHLALLLRAYASSGTPTLTVRLWSGTPWGAPGTVVSEDTITLSTTETNFAPDCKTTLSPAGGLQQVTLQAKVSSGTAYVTAACLCVATKRGT
jgi:hypothetical protein